MSGEERWREEAKRQKQKRRAIQEAMERILSLDDRMRGWAFAVAAYAVMLGAEPDDAERIAQNIRNEFGNAQRTEQNTKAIFASVRLAVDPTDVGDG